MNYFLTLIFLFQFSARYYKRNKERLQKWAREKYQDLFKEKKKKKKIRIGSRKIWESSWIWKAKAGWVQKKNYKIWKIKSASQIKTEWCCLARNRMQDVFLDKYVKLVFRNFCCLEYFCFRRIWENFCFGKYKKFFIMSFLMCAGISAFERV